MEIRRNKINLLDSALARRSDRTLDEPSRFGGIKQQSITLFSRGRRTAAFFTADSKLYFTPREQELKRQGKLSHPEGKFDSLSSRIVSDYMKYRPTSQKDRLIARYQARLQAAEEKIQAAGEFWQGQFVSRAWNFSIIGAILFGMLSMSLIYRYLGPGALADSHKSKKGNQETQLVIPDRSEGRVLGAETEKLKFSDQNYFEEVLDDLIKARNDEFESKLREMVKGYPIEEMVPYIAEKDPIVAAFLISIARKESTWGVHVPVLDGQDCYNYWGYRGIRKLMGTGGHTCFNSRQDAVDTVAKRIEFLVKNKKLDTPAKMVIWKTGGDAAATGGQAAANKWIADVDYYFQKLNQQAD